LATSEPTGTSANWRRQITDVDVVKIGFAAAAAGRRRRATTHRTLHTRTTPVAPARAEPGGRGDAAESLERCCGGGWSRAVKVRRLLSCVGVSNGSSFNYNWSAAAAAWVVGRRYFKEQ